MSLHEPQNKIHPAKTVLFALAIMLGALISPTWSGYDQARKSELYDEVPSDRRESFGRRLKMLIYYQHEQEWNKMYELLWSGIKHKQTQKQFIRHAEDWYARFPDERILDFVPHTVKSSNVPGWDEWLVFGCALVSSKGHRKNLEGMLSAYFENGDWYFTEPGIITSIDGPPTECDCVKGQKRR